VPRERAGKKYAPFNSLKGGYKIKNESATPDRWRSFVDKILKFYGSNLNYEKRGLIRDDMHVNHAAKPRLERELRDLGFSGIEEAVDMSSEERDEVLKKIVALMIYKKEKITDPIERDYQYEVLKEEVDEDLEKEAEEQIFEWKKERKKRRIEEIVEESEDEWKMGDELRRASLEKQFTKQKFQALIGYYLFWRNEDGEVELGVIDPKFKEQLEEGKTDIHLRKALKDIGKELKEDVEICKVGEDEWELVREVLGSQKRFYKIEETSEGLRVFVKVVPAKKDILKEAVLKVPVEKGPELEFLKEFEKWDEMGSWEERGELKIRIQFKDYSIESKKGLCERELKEYLRLYDASYLDETVRDFRIKELVK